MKRRLEGLLVRLLDRLFPALRELPAAIEYREIMDDLDHGRDESGRIREKSAKDRPVVRA